MAAKLMERCFPDGAKTVVMASGEREMDSLLACSLAGALESPFLLFQDEHIPDATAQELKRLGPSRIVILNSGGVSAAETQSNINLAAGSALSLEFDSVEAASSPELSHLVFEYGKERSLWGESVIATWSGCVGDLTSLSPYMYSKKSPILLQEQKEPTISDQIHNDIQAGGFSTFFALSGEHGFPEFELQEYRDRGVKVVRFCADGPYKANEAINNWIVESQETDNDVENLLVSSIWNPADAFAAGPYAAKTNALILLEDPQDLDSVAHAINYIEAQRGKIKRITFIGNHTRFSYMDKLLLAKTVTRVLKENE